MQQEGKVSFTCKAVSWVFINKNRQLGILRQNFHLLILLSYSSHWTQQVDGFSPVMARAAGIKDQACLTSLLVGVPTHTHRRPSAFLAQSPLSPALPPPGAPVTMGPKVVPRVDVGTLQSEESEKRVLEWTPFPGLVSFLQGL